MKALTMCTNYTCEEKEYCYRYAKPPEEDQEYAFYAPWGDSCNYFMEIYGDAISPLDVDTTV